MVVRGGLFLKVVFIFQENLGFTVSVLRWEIELRLKVMLQFC